MNVQLNIQILHVSAVTDLKEMLSVTQLSVEFISDYKSERIIKIGPYLPKLS